MQCQEFTNLTAVDNGSPFQTDRLSTLSNISYILYTLRVFSLATAGLISTSSTQNINYETVSATSTSYQLTVTVSDGYDTSTSTLTVSIADKNEAPVFGKATYAISGTEGAVCVIGRETNLEYIYFVTIKNLNKDVTESN